MLFFDDERRNAVVQSLGVTFVLIEDRGLTKEVFEQGILEWRKFSNEQTNGVEDGV